jgi:hypothetical protein
MVRTKPHKTSQSPAYKRLSLEQENAVDLLILGKSDREVAEAGDGGPHAGAGISAS